MWIFLFIIPLAIIILVEFLLKKRNSINSQYNNRNIHKSNTLEDELKLSVKLTNNLYPHDKAREFPLQIKKTTFAILQNAINSYSSAGNPIDSIKFLGLALIAISHNAGVVTYELFGDNFEREQCIKVANAALNLELYSQSQTINDEFLSNFFTRAIIERSMYTQCATIITNFYIGYPEKARNLATISRKAISASDPNKAHAEVISALSSLEHITIPDSTKYATFKRNTKNSSPKSALYQELDKVLANIYDNTLGVKQEIETSIKSIIKKEEKNIINAINDNKLTYKNVIAIIVNENLFERLRSGQYHVYRGTLSIIGNELLKAYKINQKYCVSEKIMTEDDYRNNIEVILEEIKYVG